LGISSHGARPANGLNAVSVLMKFFDEINLQNEDVRDFIDFYNQHIGFDLCGASIGCGLEDEPSGKLIFNVGMVNIDDESASVTVNIRYPVTMNEEQVYESMLPVINQYNLGIVKKEHKGPIYVPRDDKMIQTLMDVYKKHTGDMNCEPKVIGGGTYARACRNTVAFGADFPGEPELAHQKNEHITIAKLIKCAEIYADAIFELAGGQLPRRTDEEFFDEGSVESEQKK